MNISTLTTARYGFRIRVRNGAIVEKLLILGESQEEAQKKLYRMYPHCKILSMWEEGVSSVPGNAAARATFEEIADLLSR